MVLKEGVLLAGRWFKTGLIKARSVVLAILDKSAAFWTTTMSIFCNLVAQQDNRRPGVQRWKLNSNEKYLIASVDRDWTEKSENYLNNLKQIL
jgi:hypothetical protein